MYLKETAVGAELIGQGGRRGASGKRRPKQDVCMYA